MDDVLWDLSIFGFVSFVLFGLVIVKTSYFEVHLVFGLVLATLPTLGNLVDPI